MSAPLSAAEKARFDTPPQDLMRKLRPFDFGRHQGIKPAHVKAFLEVAARLNVTLLLRATNPASIAYMEKNGYAPKPIDCKPKTCDLDIVIGSQPVDCAGLVADPHVVGAKAYKGSKLPAALECWASFEAAMHKRSLGPGVTIYERAEQRGFYAVDLAPPDSANRHHGCLLVSELPAPPDFDTRKSHSRQWMRRHMGYVHGDYDLYGVIDNDAAAAAAATGERLAQQQVRNAPLLGQTQFVSARTHEAVQALNGWFHADLVQHGEQSAWKYSADDVYVFFPSGAACVVLQHDFKAPGREMPAWFEDLYRYVFKTAYAGRDRVSGRALR